jgi:hypothetical protein
LLWLPAGVALATKAIFRKFIFRWRVPPHPYTTPIVVMVVDAGHVWSVPVSSVNQLAISVALFPHIWAALIGMRTLQVLAGLLDVCTLLIYILLRLRIFACFVAVLLGLHIFALLVTILL